MTGGGDEPLVLKCALLNFTSTEWSKTALLLALDATVAEIPGGEWHSVVFHAPRGGGLGSKGRPI